MDALPQMIYDTVTQHIPDSTAWVPYVGTAVLALFGLLLMAKGAKLAPLLAACAFLGIGGIAGSFPAHWLGTPVWPTMAVTGVLGFILGLALFKFWLAVLLAGCFVAGSLSLYGVQVVSPHMTNYASRNYEPALGPVGVALAKPDAAVTLADSAQGELAQYWSYAASQVPGFQASFWAIAISTGLAGLALGLLLPRIARALFASTAGTLCLFVALTAVLKAGWPDALTWLHSLGAWGWGIVGAAWGVSLVYNLVDIRPKSPRTSSEDQPETARGKPSTA